MLNGPGFIYDQVRHLWLVEVATGGSARRLTTGPRRTRTRGLVARRPADRVRRPGRPRPRPRLAVRRPRRGRRDGHARSGSPTGGPPPSITRPGCRTGRRSPCRPPLPRAGGSRNDIWLFAADGSRCSRAGAQPDRARRPDARRRHGQRRHARRAGPDLGSPRTALAPASRAPIRGSYELWRSPVRRRGRAPDGGSPLHLGLATRPATRTAACASRPSASSCDGARRRPRARPRGRRRRRPRRGRAATACRTTQRRRARGDRAPPARRPLGDGRRAGDPGLARPVARRRSAASRRPSSSRSTAGPTRCTAGRPTGSSRCSPGAGMSVVFTQPARLRRVRRGLQRREPSATGATGRRATCSPTSTPLVAAGVADPARLGVTGGSYGGYLTNWIVGHSTASPPR